MVEPVAPIARVLNPRKQRQQRKRELLRAAKAAAAVEAARRAELADEEIAPAVQRHGVVTEDGEVYRVPRVERLGLTFKRSNPVHHLVARGTCTRAHERAADRLARAWEDGGRGVGRGAAPYGERTSGTPQSGWISDQVLAQLGYQNRCRAEFAGAQTWLGALFPAVQAVVLDGIDLTAWTTLAGHPNAQVARGYLVAALDRLVEFYEAVEAARRGPDTEVEIRSVVVGR